MIGIILAVIALVALVVAIEFRTRGEVTNPVTGNRSRFLPTWTPAQQAPPFTPARAA